jgi:OmpA-OmpF porin, OOP family
MKKTIIALTALSALSVSALAGAQGSSIYINGNVGAGSMTDIDTGKLSPIPGITITTAKEALAWSVNAGYQFGQYWAFEVGYMRIPGVKGSIDVAGVEGSSGSFKVFPAGFAIAAKGIYPVKPQVNVYGKVGAIFTTTVDEDSTGTNATLPDTDATALLLAAGVSYDFNENFSLSFEGDYTTASGDLLNSTFFGLAGLTYKFAI